MGISLDRVKVEGTKVLGLPIQKIGLGKNTNKI